MMMTMLVVMMMMMANDTRGWMGPSFRFVLQLRKNPRKSLNQENWPDRESNPGPLGERKRCYPCTTAGVAKEKRKGLREENIMERDFWWQQIVWIVGEPLYSGKS